jgi:hypothetical protein
MRRAWHLKVIEDILRVSVLFNHRSVAWEDRISSRASSTRKSTVLTVGSIDTRSMYVRFDLDDGA